ncbi:MAG: guanylate kinase [Ignavibacteriales bacterium]
MGSPASGKGLLVVMSAPSGAGKGTLRRALINDRPDIVFCPSVTTREPRPGEAPGIDYHFVSTEEFERKARDGEFAEWAVVYGNLYGTPKRALDELLAAGRTVLIEKDVQGAVALRPQYPEAVYVFVLPPSFEELRRRVENRGTETRDQMCRRLESYESEVLQLDNYDYVIVNDDLDRAKRVLEGIIVAEGCRVSRCRGLLLDGGREGG